jgi:hypothetical protein
MQLGVFLAMMGQLRFLSAAPFSIITTQADGFFSSSL